MKYRKFLRVFYAANDGAGAGGNSGASGGEGGAGGNGSGTGGNGAGGQQNQTPEFDYEKLASLVAGKQSVTEESVLKGYFKQQGLTKEQMEQAIASFKQQQAANNPDVGALQTQLTQAQELARETEIKNAAIMEAVSLGLDAKTIPYILKIADFTGAVGQDGKINKETLKNAVSKVLEDVPQFKPVTGQQNGFQIGGGGNQQPQNNQSDLLAGIFGNKK